MRFTAVIVASLSLASAARAGDASSPHAEPVLDPPTLHCLGAYWIVRGDDDKDAKVAVDYRMAGAEAWVPGPPLFRVAKGAYGDDRKENVLNPSADAWVFAGSVFGLTPDTAYELRLTLSDPDGGANVVKTLTARTIAEPVAAASAPKRHVVPGDGGGSGTEADPFQGLAAAQSAAKPGDVMLLHAGVYDGPFEVDRNGQPGKPIVWRGAGGGKTVIQLKEKAKGSRVIAASGANDVWFEGLTIRNATWGIVANDAARVVVRRCHITGVDYGLAVNRNTKENVTGFFVCDNLIEGPSVWPRSKGIEAARGIQLTGSGHVVCYNRIRGFADAMNTFPSPVCVAMDFHNNDISECTDDGAELDFAQRNCRNFQNRYTNVYQGISLQPVYGGPVYVFRNALYNVPGEPFKLHNGPSGAVIVHNTIVKNGRPWHVSTPEPFGNCVTRNNLFLGTTGDYAFECSPKTDGCDFDYDGFGGLGANPFRNFLKWNGNRFRTIEDVRAKAPIERHAVIVDPGTAFSSGLQPPEDAAKQHLPETIDLRLNEKSAAVDAGERLPGFNDAAQGKGPDLGAYGVGAEVPHYGPRGR